MEIKKILSRILAIICVITLTLPSFSTVLAETTENIGKAGDTVNLGISLLNKDGWGYRIQDRLTYRIHEIKDSKKDYSRNFYCLDYTKKFPMEKDRKSVV